MRAIGAFLGGLWRVLDGLRKVLHLLLMLLLFGLVLAASQTSLPIFPRSAALVLAPQGQVVEELSGDPLERAFDEASGAATAETRLRDLIDAVDHARDDNRVKALVLELGGLERAGLPALQDLARSITWFREAGKKVFVYGEYFTQRQYYLAAHADEVYLDPLGFVMIDGLAYYRTYFRGAADKLGVDINVFRIGSHKSAPETWTRTDMSANDREEAQVWVGALWDAYRADVAKARGLDAAAIQAYADEAVAGVRATGGDMAQYARVRGLVDGLKSRAEFEQHVAGVAGEDEETHSFRAIDWQPYVTAMRSEKVLRSRRDRNVGVIVASGEILDGDQPPGTVGGDTLAAMLREARHDDRYSAVVLRIDSPGGSMMASEVVRREVAALREAGKPVVASMGTVAASGGYYIAMDADRIIAAPTTITGSIGVYAIVPTLQRSLGKLGITNDGFGTTELAGAARLDRELTPQAKALLQSGVEHAYRTFVNGVAAARKRRYEEIDGLAQGRVWTGDAALAAGIIDGLGNIDEAIAEAAGLAGLEEGYGVEWIERELSWRDFIAMRIRGVAAWLVSQATPSWRLPLDAELGAAARRAQRLLMLARQGRPVYLCGCRID